MELIWTDGDIIYFTRDTSAFDIEAICKLGPSRKLPHVTHYGVARWIKRIEGDYYWVVLRN